MTITLDTTTVGSGTADRRVHRGLPPGGAGAAMSATAWRRVGRVLTAAVFAMATVLAVYLGVRAPEVSPVAPPAASAAAPAPVAAPSTAAPQAPPDPRDGRDRGFDGPRQRGR
jgi:hypothetical protein